MFTAPVTGIYNFSMRVKLGNLAVANDDLILNIITTSVTYEVGFSGDSEVIENPTSESGIAGHVLCAMTGGDTATFTITENGGGAGSVDIIGNANGAGTYIMGWLVS